MTYPGGTFHERTNASCIVRHHLRRPGNSRRSSGNGLGILHSETEPLIVGALGTVGGVFLLWAGITLLISSSLSATLVPAAYVCIPISIICGVIKHYAAWPITTVGILYPLLMFVYYRLVSRKIEARQKI